MDEAIRAAANTIPSIAQQGDFGLVVLLILGGLVFLGFLAWLLISQLKKDAPTKQDLLNHEQQNEKDFEKVRRDIRDLRKSNEETKEIAARTESKLDTFIEMYKHGDNK